MVLSPSTRTRLLQHQRDIDGLEGSHPDDLYVLLPCPKSLIKKMLIQVNGNNHSMSLNYTVSVLQHGPPILDLIKGAFARSILLLTLVNSLRLSSYLEFRPLLVKIINLLFDFISSIMPLKNIISTRLATKCIWLVSVSCSGSSIWQWFTCKLQIKMF